MASSLSQAQNWNHKRRKDVSGSFINETLGAFWLRQAGPIQSLDHSLSVPPSLSSPPFPQYAQCFTQFFSPILLFTMLVFSFQCLFSVARQEICKNIWSFFSPPFLITIVCTWWIFLRRWTPFSHSGREPPLQCTATLWHWKGGSLAHWGSTGRGLHCHKPSWPNPLERHRRAASPIHFLIGDSERERILTWQKTNHVLSCVKS